MSARILDGKSIAASLRARLAFLEASVAEPDVMSLRARLERDAGDGRVRDDDGGGAAGLAHGRLDDGGAGAGRGDHTLVDGGDRAVAGRPDDLCARDLAPRVVEVGFRPTALGAAGGALRISSDDEDLPDLD